jgi:hypothetical protein
MPSQRSAEQAAAAKYGLTYKPGQAAGTAAMQYAAQKAQGNLAANPNQQAAIQNGYTPQGTPLNDSFNRTSSNFVMDATGAPQAPQAGQTPVDTTSAASKWTLENDPTYQAALATGQSAFNVARINAKANLNSQALAANQSLTKANQQAALDRRSLAGSYAARGMQGGAHGAYYRAQDQMNADQITAQTSTKDQLAALNQQYLSNYGTDTGDWTATTEGQNYKNQAVQQALSALASKYTTV